MMTQKQRYVFHAMDSGDICVFPSEVSARSYLSLYALSGSKGAAFSDHAISFDTFRKLFIPDSETAVLATPTIRQLFLSASVKEGLSLPYFLHGSHEESEGSIIRYLSTILPQLKPLEQSEAFSTLDPGMQQDYRTLSVAYGEFLSSHSIVEPDYLEPVIPPGHGTYRVLFCDSILGFSRFYKKLGSPSWVIPVPVEEPEEKPLLLEYSNHVTEIKETLREIHRLLEEGVPCRDIVISTAREETMASRIADEAKLYDVPLVVRLSQHPLDYAAGRFFQQLRDLYQEEFSFQTMEQFLLENGIPWNEKEQKDHLDLLSHAVDLAIDQGSLHGEDLWDIQLRRKNEKHLHDWYLRFKQFVISLNEKKSFGDFLVAFHGFEDQYFLPTQWNGTKGEDLARFCVNSMESLAGEMKEAGVVNADGGFLSLFLSYLKDKPYVPQHAGEKGINLYRWTDSAAISVPHHFILSLDWGATQSIDKPFSCLGEAVSEKLREEEDLTKATLETLGEKGVVLSYHKSDYQGEYLAPAFFSDVRKGETSDDPYVMEQTLWAKGDVPGKANNAQSDSYMSAKGHCLDRNGVEQYSKGGHPWPRALVDKQKEKNLSPTLLDLFKKCPFAYACRYFLGAKETNYSVDIIDHKTIGSVLHRTYERFFRQFQDKPFDSAEIDRYREQLERLFTESVNEKFGPSGPNPFVRVWLIHTYQEQCTKILEEEADCFDHLHSVLFEKGEERTWIGFRQSFTVEGKVDRILTLDDGTLALVDYKKGEAPMKSSDTEFSTIQLPVYRYLFGNVMTAGYYSVKTGKYVIIWSEYNPSMMATGDKTFAKVMEAFAEHFESGIYETTDDSDNCANCAYRSVCRRRYSTI
jgi:CRISPR/Cas system-associated exonuclease Cas4 (RecB family)